jgi:hypothetical protein
MFASSMRITTVDIIEDSGFRFARADLESRASSVLRGRKNILAYGLPRQGKSTLIKYLLKDTSHVIVHASRSMRFEDITRNYLLSIGCSITAERRNRSRSGRKAEIKFGWSGLGLTGGGEQGDESEITEKSVSVDISNPNDVSYLIKHVGSRHVLIVDHAEQLDEKERGRLLEFARMCYENGTIRICLIVSSVDVPLTLMEKILHLPHLNLLYVPPLLAEEVEAFSAAALAAMGSPCQVPAGAIYKLFSGSVGLTLDACQILADQSLAGALAPDRAGSLLEEQFLNSFMSYYVSLIAAIVEADWDLECLTGEAIARQLEEATSGSSNGTATSDEPEQPDTAILNIGSIMAEMLLEADLTADVDFTQETLVGHLAARNMVPLLKGNGTGRWRRSWSAVRSVAAVGKRLEKLQRKLLISPQLISVNDTRSKIRLWSAEYANAAERIRPSLADLAEMDD